MQKDPSSEIVLMPDAASKEVAMDQELVRQSLRIISEEVGVPMDELTDDMVFDDIGMDSTISLMISARFQKELSLGGTNNILWNSSNVKELKTTLGAIRNQLALPKLPRKVADEKLTPTLTTAFVDKYSAHLSKLPSTNTPHGQPESIRIQNPMLRATSVLLYGRPQSAAKTLILFPDASGSATSYINVQSVRESLCIIALNCPYLHSPENMTCTLDKLMDYYIVEIRRRQPTGPYHFGGWSCGGVLAYRASQLFIQEGEVVETLSLIDAPAPNGLDPLPDRWYEHCSRHGVFRELFSGKLSSAPESQSIPDWLIPHFHANVNILKDYHAEALPAGSAPRTSILWASDCVTDGGKFPDFTESPSDPEGIKFLTEKGSTSRQATGDTSFLGVRLKL